MAHFLTPEQLSERMSRIRSKDTKPELLVCKAVWSAVYCYRLHKQGLPGRPDFVFASLRTVVFVHGSYCHAHTCQKGRVPEVNWEAWSEKFAGNKRRDRRNRDQLRRMGWEVYTIWGCSISTKAKQVDTVSRLLAHLGTRRKITALEKPSPRRNRKS